MHRARDERREIIRAIISDQSLDSFGLSEKETLFFRRRSARALDQAVRSTGAFTEYYVLPTEKPFGRVVFSAGLVIAACIVAFIWVYRTAHDTPPWPIYAALIAISAAAAGWIVTSDVAHRNTVRQNTNAVVFARFAQAPFGDAITRFHDAFGYTVSPRISAAQMAELRASERETDRRAASSVIYLLNYFEFVASGVLRGDLDARIVQENNRGLICHYYDKCSPLIDALNRSNPLAYEHLRKLRTSYHEV